MTTLFDTPPLSRSTHPRTSHIAERQIRTDGTLAKRAAYAMGCVMNTPGMTAAELEQHHGVRDGVIRKRLAGLRYAGSLHNGLDRLCRVTGRVCQTWYPGGAV
jgi:hypothetical protein